MMPAFCKQFCFVMVFAFATILTFQYTIFADLPEKLKSGFLAIMFVDFKS